jgi:hypothetical protein
MQNIKEIKKTFNQLNLDDVSMKVFNLKKALIYFGVAIGEVTLSTEVEEKETMIAVNEVLVNYLESIEKMCDKNLDVSLDLFNLLNPDKKEGKNEE